MRIHKIALVALANAMLAAAPAQALGFNDVKFAGTSGALSVVVVLPE